MLLQKPMEDPFWKEIVPSFEHLSKRELDMFPGHPWTHGWKYTTVICDSQLYMRYMHKLFVQVCATQHVCLIIVRLLSHGTLTSPESCSAMY